MPFSTMHLKAGGVHLRIAQKSKTQGQFQDFEMGFRTCQARGKISVTTPILLVISAYKSCVCIFYTLYSAILMHAIRQSLCCSRTGLGRKHRVSRMLEVTIITSKSAKREVRLHPTNLP